MGHPVASTTSHSRSASLLQRIGHWLAETLNHAWGNPAEEAQHQPPSIGVQPYSDSRPSSSRRSRRRR